MAKPLGHQKDFMRLIAKQLGGEKIAKETGKSNVSVKTGKGKKTKRFRLL